MKNSIDRQMEETREKARKALKALGGVDGLIAIEGVLKTASVSPCAIRKYPGNELEYLALHMPWLLDIAVWAHYEMRE